MPGNTVPFDELTGLGPFFALQPSPEDTSGWHGAQRLLEDPTVTDAAIDLYAARLGTGRRDIAGSLLVQGWAGRLTSVFAGCAVLTQGVPDLAAANLRYRFADGAPAEFAITDPTLADTAPRWRRLVDHHLETLVAAVDGRCRTGRRRLWGNVAAAMAGSLEALARGGTADLDELTRLTWAQPAELAGLGQWVPTVDGVRYARRTCCNIVRVPGYGLCADCVIGWEPRLRR